METLAQGLLIAMAVLLLAQGALVCGFVWALLSWRRPRLDDSQCPKAAVVLCLRGSDPFLRDCIRGLIDQDYPAYTVSIVVDREDDPAWEVAQSVIAETSAPHVHMQSLRSPRRTCTLKCSSLIQAVSQLDETVAFVAQLDADTVPHRTWLRELAAPLIKEDVGAATGNRWYMPVAATNGALVRFLWNACAIIQMYWYRIAWGGTLAVKTDVIRKCGLLDRWAQAFCEDTMLYAALRKENLKVAFVPSLMMVNRESCDVSGFFRWVSRQLLCARLYHPRFSSVLIHGVMVTVLSVVTFGVVACAAVQRDGSIVGIVAGGWLLYELVLTVFIVPMEIAVRKIVASRGQPTAWVTPRTVVVGLLGVGLLQILYPAALFCALVARTVNWRGVRYRIDRGGRLEMVEYRPYATDQEGDKNASL